MYSALAGACNKRIGEQRGKVNKMQLWWRKRGEEDGDSRKRME